VPSKNIAIIAIIANDANPASTFSFEEWSKIRGTK
jgi:hypothetical protein